jgi:hypothetical protein
MTYHFGISIQETHTQVDVYRDSDKVFEVWLCTHDSGDVEVHLPPFKSQLQLWQTRYLWRYLAGQLPFTRYRAYIKDSKIKRLAKHCGFIDQGDYLLCLSTVPSDQPTP